MMTPTDRDREIARKLLRSSWFKSKQEYEDSVEQIATALAAERERIISDLAGAEFNDAADFLNGDKQ